MGRIMFFRWPSCLLAALCGGLLIPLELAYAEWKSTFALACTFRGDKATFVTSGDTSSGEATIAYEQKFRPAFAEADLGTDPKPTIAILVRGRSSTRPSRDLYIIDTALGIFTHVHENYADGPDKPPVMAVQGGTCTAAR
jgi:hypothetical protein